MSYCTNCGTQERDDQRFCVVCGTPTPGAAATTPMPAMPPLVSGAWIGEAQVRVGFSMDPPRQSRWSILFRLLLSFPLLVVALGIGIAAAFVTIAAWFCALITKRVPDDIQRFLTNALRLYANVVSYAFLLTSRWPGISFNPKPNDQVTIDIDHVELSRWAVFFRYPLLFPGNIVGALLAYGSYPVLFVMWIWGIIAGREPRALHQAISLVLRYQIRYQAYVSMLTPTQPFKGFLGDGVYPTSSPVVIPASVEATELAPGAAPSVAGSMAQVVTPATAGPAATSPLTDHWFVVKGAKALVVIMLVLSIPAYVLPFAFASSAFDSFPLVNGWKTFVARLIVAGANDNVTNTMNQFQVSVQGCSSTQSVTCVASAASQAYTQLSKQTAVMTNHIFFPSDSLNKAVRYEAALQGLESAMLQLETSSSYQFDQGILTTSIPTSLAVANAAYRALNAQLHK